MNIRLLSFSFAVLGAAGSSFAQTWDGGGGTGAWATANNWNPNSVPASGASVIFDGANANSQWAINLGANRTVTGITFINAAGANPFTFSNNTLTVGTGGIANNDTDAQTFNSAITLSGAQTWNGGAGGLNVAGAVNVNGKALIIDGAGDVALSGAISGNGSITKQGAGALNLTGGGAYSGSFNVSAGSALFNLAGSFKIPNAINLTGGSFEIQPGTDFQGFGGAVSISGGSTLKVTPGGQITTINSGTMTFGSTGGTLDLNGQLGTNPTIGTFVIDSVAATPAIVQYGVIANNATSPFGWDTGGHILTVANNDLSGSGALEFLLSNGAMVEYRQNSFLGSMNYTGASGGSAAAGSAGANVGRLLLNSATTFTFGGGLSFDNAMQVTITGANRTIDSDITINSGSTAFQGESRNTGGRALTLATSVGGRTLTVKDGASAIMDIRFRDESSLNDIGNVILNANTVLEAGGTLSFTKSATVASETVGMIALNGNITAQGTLAKESTFNLGTSLFSTAVGSTLTINGTGTGGLRVQGTQANVDAYLTTARLQGLAGSGGTLTLAYSDSLPKTFSTAPTTGSNVALGFDAQGGSSPTYGLGLAANDLANWGGLVVKGGTVQLLTDQSFVGSAGTTTTLNLLGGTLTLNDGSNARTLTMEGGANLTAGTLNGGTSAGTLVIGGDLTHGTATLLNNPNITMNVSGANQISGSAITGVGTLTKTGVGTVTLNTSLTANTIDIQNGTLLLGGANQIGDSTALKLSGGTFGTGGYSETVGALTLSASSTIDLGGGASILNFADSSGATWSSTALYVVNWNGSWLGGGTDQLVFGGLLSGQVSDIIFVNPNGSGGMFGSRILPSGEIVPVPEPATIGFGALLLSGLGFRERQRLNRWTRALLRKFALA